jgi:hypothetical protein
MLPGMDGHQFGRLAALQEHYEASVVAGEGESWLAFMAQHYFDAEHIQKHQDGEGPVLPFYHVCAHWTGVMPSPRLEVTLLTTVVRGKHIVEDSNCPVQLFAGGIFRPPKTV